MATRIVAAQAITREVDGKLVEFHRGDEVELTGDDEKLADANGSLVPVGSTLAEHEEHLDNLYRGGRGDITAAGRLNEARSGGIVDVDDPFGGASSGEVEQLAAWLRDEQPTIDETVEMAHGDPERARQLLEAENLATGQNPRAGVTKGLEKITSGGE